MADDTNNRLKMAGDCTTIAREKNDVEIMISIVNYFWNRRIKQRKRCHINFSSATVKTAKILSASEDMFDILR